MTRTFRLALFALASLSLLPGLLALVRAMPSFGAHPQPYADAINAAAPVERHITNMVSAVNFDYRGFDTLGEEFMLVCAVTGTVVLLRGNRGEQLDAKPGIIPGRPIVERSDAVVLTARLIVPITLLFGLYIALHAMTTPGGGFQGGVIIASSLLLLYVGEGYRAWRRVMRFPVFDALEGGGAALYAAWGLTCLALGSPFLTNLMPLGQMREVFSGGAMILENAGVTLAVAGGFSVLFIEFLEETRASRRGEDS